ncbi:MAG: amidohydrolase family protein [Gemmatimonadota bacterium]
MPTSAPSLKSTLRALCLALVTALPVQDAAAQRQGGGEENGSRWDVTQARGATRQIDFTTEEGTRMAVDLSPDGTWIAFDLLGHIYRMPVAGGEAQVLTQSAGVALSVQPRISPDGSSIAFITDRGGQYNLWIMDADGGNPRAVFSDLNVTAFEPAWTPDGDYIVVRRATRGAPGGGGGGGNGLWLYHKDGGRGVQLVGTDGGAPSWPTVSGDGRFLYFQVNRNVSDGQPLSGSQQVKRFEFKTGEIVDISAGISDGAAAGRQSSGGAAAPEVSPDGRWLAFARHIPDGVLSFKGQEFGPRSALWLRDLQTGAERLLMDPIEPIIASGGKTLGVLPRYDWASDGRSVLITQGGKIRRVDVASGDVSTIPFQARVQRTISEMARKEFRITDDPIDVVFFRWPTSTADGGTLAFQAVGRIYTQQGSGQPRRVTAESFDPLEYMPAWSPDGRWIAFVSWDDTIRGHVWKVPAAGGQPQRLSREPGDYAHPVWSPDGRSVVVARGEGATARQQTMTANAYFDLVRFSANPPSGGEAGAYVVTIPGEGVARRQLVGPSFGPDGRIFYPEIREPEGGGRSRTSLMSVAADGSDKQEHLSFPNAEEIVPSPTGRWVAFQEGDNVYVQPMGWESLGGEVLEVDKRRGALPVTQLTRDGGLFPRWRNETTLEYGSGPRHYVHHLDTGVTDTTTLALRVPRAVPQGRIALTGARIVTLNDRQVIENGTIVVDGSRIACVGQCDTNGVARTIDARGKTIIPGFVDMHAHHYREWRGIRPRHDYEQAIYLAYGVTTTMDVSMWSQNMFPTAELIEAGEMIGPRGFSTGDNQSGGDGPHTNEISNLADAVAAVRRLTDWGATQIKQYAQPRRDQRQWFSEAARQIGVNITSEGGSFVENLGMIMDGQTAWEHAFSEVPMYSDGARFLGQAQATYSPTLVVAGPAAWSIEYFFQESDVWKDPKQRHWFPWRMLVPQTRNRWLRPTTDYSFPLIAQAMADIISEGGYGAVGSHGEHHGLATHWETWMGASALGNHGALEVASLHGARLLGADQDLGSIEVGKLADLMILNANPLDDIRATTDAQYVMKGGTLYEAMSLDQVWPNAVPFGPAYWLNDDAMKTDTVGTDVFDRRGG